MGTKTKKSWKKSKNRGIYLKVALQCLTSPSKVYDVAHKNSSSNWHEKMIRQRLVQNGVLRYETGDNFDDKNQPDLTSRHI